MTSGPGHEHVARAVHHHGEVGDGRRVDRAAGARPHDRGDLRHDAGRERVAEKDVRVAGKGKHALLNPGAARIVQADDRRAHPHGQIHDLDDLRGVRFRQRPAEHREVLRERVHGAAIDAPMTGDDAVAGNQLIADAEVTAPVGDEFVELFEAAGVEKEVYPLAGGQLPRLVLPPRPGLAATLFGKLLECTQAIDCREIGRTSPPGARSHFGRLGLLPVLEELLEPDVGERVLEAGLDDRRRTRADVGAHAAPLRRCASATGRSRRGSRS